MAPSSQSFLHPRKYPPETFVGTGSSVTDKLVGSPKEMSGPITSSFQVATDPVTPSCQLLMNNLDIHSPVSSTPIMSPFKKCLYSTPQLPAPSPSMKPFSNTFTPDRTKSESSPNVCPRSSTPPFAHYQYSPFIHHQGSPFKMCSPLGQGQDCKTSSIQTCINSTPPSTNSKCHVSTPSPRLMPLKLVDQNDHCYKPYDPSTAGNSMKSSPLVKSLDITSCHDTNKESADKMSHFDLILGFESANQKQETPQHGQSPNRKMNVSPLATPSEHENGHPPLRKINLTPRSTPRKRHEKGIPPIPNIKLTPRSSPRKRNLESSATHLMIDTDTFPSKMKLTPKSHRKVSLDEFSTNSRNSKSNAFTPDLSMASADPMISLVLSVESGNTETQELKHFPRTPKLSTNKSRSLLNPKNQEDPIQSLLCADAMVEVARANESLTDQEDSDVETDPDFVLCSPPSFGKTSIHEGTGFKLKKPFVLPGQALEHSSSLCSVPSLLGMNHLPEQDGSTRGMDYSGSVDIYQLDGMQQNASMCSLALSVDSLPGNDSRRDLFTPPPIMESWDGFRALSPPPLLQNPNQQQW